MTTTTKPARTYEWGIESSGAGEAGCLAGLTGCGHRHPTLLEAVNCQAAAYGRRGYRHLADECLAAILPGGSTDSLSETERLIVAWDLWDEEHDLLDTEGSTP